MTPPRPLRLVSSEQFRLVYREGARRTDGLLVVHLRRSGLAVSRVGIAIPRRIGGAVVRNRLRRRIREAYRQVLDDVPAGVDVVIAPKPAAAPAPFAALVDELRRLMGRRVRGAPAEGDQ